MNFYHNLVVEKSWQLLQALRKKYDFTLIGGWAVFLFTGALKSKDIDLILEFSELKRLKEEFEVSKNERLKKYEAKREEAEIDIYVPFYSNPGLPAEELKNFVVILEGFKTLEQEALAILKEKALLERKDTIKGKKDLADLISLFQIPNFNWEKHKKIIAKYNLQNYLETTFKILKRTTKINELGLNVHQMARLKKKILPFFTKQPL